MTPTWPETPLMGAVEALFRTVDDLIPPEVTQVVTACLAGGIAVHIYTGWRVSRDVDVQLSHRIAIPDETVAMYMDGDRTEALRLDTGFGDFLGLFHPDWRQDALPLRRIGRIEVKVISPTDLAVSKIGRLRGNDLEDIRQLARSGVLDTQAVQARAEEALRYFVGGMDVIRHNIRDAVDVIRKARLSDRSASK